MNLAGKRVLMAAEANCYRYTNCGAKNRLLALIPEGRALGEECRLPQAESCPMI